MIRILMVDDHFVVRAGLAAVLEGEPGIEIAAQAEDGEEALRFAAAHRPDVILMDLRMPGMGGIEATRQLVKERPEVPVLMLTTFDRDEDIQRAIQAGAKGYLMKNASAEELIEAVRTVAAGKTYFPASIATRLGQHDPDSELTPREMEVLVLLAKGLSNREIGSVLGCSENTAKTHVKHIFDKLEVSDRAEATSAAMSRGLLDEI